MEDVKWGGDVSQPIIATFKSLLNNIVYKQKVYKNSVAQTLFHAQADNHVTPSWKRVLYGNYTEKCYTLTGRSAQRWPWNEFFFKLKKNLNF